MFLFMLKMISVFGLIGFFIDLVMFIVVRAFSLFVDLILVYQSMKFFIGYSLYGSSDISLNN